MQKDRKDRLAILQYGCESPQYATDRKNKSTFNVETARNSEQVCDMRTPRSSEHTLVIVDGTRMLLIVTWRYVASVWCTIHFVSSAISSRLSTHTTQQ